MTIRRLTLKLETQEGHAAMLRTRPHDDDTLFQVGYDLAEPLDGRSPGARKCATFGKSFMEAMHLVRNQFGPEHAGAVAVREVFSREREKNGTIHDSYYFPKRLTVTTTPEAELVDA
jgi:hypothetical protein